MTTISEVQDTRPLTSRPWSRVRKAKHAQVVGKRDQLGWTPSEWGVVFAVANRLRTIWTRFEGVDLRASL